MFHVGVSWEKTIKKYAQVRALESSDKYKAYIHDQECGLYIDVDSLIAKKEDLDDSLKDALVGLKKVFL